MATVHHLPAEMVTRAFDYLDLSRLIRTSWVSTRWRAIALEHPTFWRRIRIDSIDSRTFWWMRRRIIQGGERAFVLEVDYRARHVQVEKELLDLVCATLHRVRALCITLNSIYAISVWEVLLNEAPLLEYLKLCFYLEPGAELFELKGVPMPLAIFDTPKCCRIHEVHLQNIMLPPNGPIAAFHAVEKVSISFGDTIRYRFPAYLFEFFPRMRWLALSAGTIALQPDYPDDIRILFSKLDFLDLCFSGKSKARLFARLPINDIQNILVMSPDEDAVYAALDPLRSPFHLSLKRFWGPPGERDELRITIYSPTTGHVRHFAEQFENYLPGDPDGPNPLFENDAFADQISSLTIATSVWSPILSALPAYELLQSLTVLIDEPLSYCVSLPREPLRLPALTELSFTTTRDTVTVLASDTLQFIRRLQSTNSITLKLVRVVLCGSHEELLANVVALEYLPS